MENKAFVIAICLISYASAYTISSLDDNLVLPVQALNKEDDDSFVRISENDTKIVRCPCGTKFNNNKLTCEFEKQPRTYPLPIKISTKTRCPNVPSFGSAYVNPENCRTFILCGAAGSFVMNCPANLIFNKNLGVCDYPQTASCCEYEEKDSEPLFLQM